MKKRFWVYTTILALLLSFSVLFVSVYAALSQNVSIKNNISFAGTDQEIKFSLTALITGTKQDGADALKTSWEYDMNDMDQQDTYDWAVGNIEFDNEGKTIDEIKIVYCFNIKNASSCPLLVEFDGPNKKFEGGVEGEIIDGLVGTHYISLLDSEGNVVISEKKGTQIQMDMNQSAVLKFVLTVTRIQDFACNESIDFKLVFSAGKTLGE